MIAIRPHAPALLHGGTVRLTPEQIDTAISALVKRAAHLEHDRYRDNVGLLARIAARLDMMDRIYATHPRSWIVRATRSGKVQLSNGEKYYLTLIEQARRLLNDLGLTPAAAKALGLSVDSPDQVTVEALRQQFTRSAGKDETP